MYQFKNGAPVVGWFDVTVAGITQRLSRVVLYVDGDQTLSGADAVVRVRWNYNDNSIPLAIPVSHISNPGWFWVNTKMAA